MEIELGIAAQNVQEIDAVIGVENKANIETKIDKVDQTEIEIKLETDTKKIEIEGLGYVNMFYVDLAEHNGQGLSYDHLFCQ